MSRFATACILFCLFAMTFMTVPAQAGAPGLGGTVKEMGSNYFIMDIGGEHLVKVYVDSNTVFQNNGAKADASIVAEGASVKVVGHSVSNNVVQATGVNVTSGGKAKQKKK